MNPKQTGRGFQKLINRYGKRAEDLLYDPDFNELIGLLRSGWNNRYPSFRVEIRDNMALPYVPRIPPRLWKQLQADYQSDETLLVPTLARSAAKTWVDMVSNVEDRYWLPEDFNSVFRWNTMTAEFTAACVLHGPKSLPEDVSAYFPNKVHAIFAMLVESAQRDRIILLPLHPDMNDEDINSFKKFADVLRQERFDGTTSARIDRLRLEGKSDNHIARRLGLSRQTVNAHPRLH